MFVFSVVTIINEINLKKDQIMLTLPMIFDPFVHIEWLINIENYSSIIIFDIENFDRNIPAELIIPQSKKKK